jgi:lipid-binding SYLF domain-containing protein
MNGNNLSTLVARLAMAATLMVGVTGTAFAQTADIKDEVEQSDKAARVFTEIMGAPDRAIPQNILDSAQCVAVFPSVIKAAFGIGGRGGRGLASCRTADGWSAPAYFKLGGGSFGFQIGVESTDLVMLFMTDDGINSLLRSKFELGADASVAAGPVGRQAGASTDLKLNSQILSYSRGKGLFAGVALNGAVIESADDDMRDVYGAGVTAKEALRGAKAAAAVRAFPDTLGRYSARKTSR